MEIVLCCILQNLGKDIDSQSFDAIIQLMLFAKEWQKAKKKKRGRIYAKYTLVSSRKA